MYFEYGSEDERAALDAEELAEQQLAEHARQNQLKSWHLRTSEDIFLTPYNAPEAIIPGLQIARGRPCGIVGAPHAGKNDFAQAIALAIASGKDAFGRFPVTRRAKVCHITYDMGDWGTRIRYRRLANGMNLAPRDIDGMLALSPYPAMNLSAKDARKEFARLLKGFDVCILDNARAATPGVDENSSLFGERITAFGQACEDAGSIGIYLHHTRKASREVDEEVSLESLRGTSAIAGASGAIWYVAPTEGIDSPRFAKMLRTHDVMPEVCEDFYLHHMKCNHTGNFDAADLPPIKLIASDSVDTPMEGGMLKELHQRIMLLLDNEGAMNLNELRQALKCHHGTLRSALAELQNVGQIMCQSTKGKEQIYTMAVKV